jgi:hypothetical protein
MRQDMNKVLTERPRTRNILSYRSTRHTAKQMDYDALPAMEGMARPYQENPKGFSDLLGPLQRFLHSCIGRPWDDVWSEICQHLSRNTTTGNHLLGHVASAVDVKCTMSDGKVWVQGRLGVHEPYNLYVHPETGLICPGQRPSRRAFRPGNRVTMDGVAYLKEGYVYTPASEYVRRNRVGFARMIDGKKEGVKLGGIWYWVGFAIVPPPVTRYYFDPATAKAMGAQQIGPGRYVKVMDSHMFDFVLQKQARSGERCRVDKKQMGRSDLRRYGLVNG